MRAFLALLRREYLEHRWAFLYAPMLLIGVLTLLTVSGIATGRYRFFLPGTVVPSRLFDLAYSAIAVLWGGYCFIAVFFYFADAFHSDRRNNQMFFWKSMPHTDLTMLMSKLVAGLTVLPGLIFFACLLSGLLVAALLLALPGLVPGLGMPDLPGTLYAWAQVSVLVLAYLAVLLAWYAPFFAWIGALSTVVGRWSIPLGLLIPVLVSLVEGVMDFGSVPGGNYVLHFLRERISFDFDALYLLQALLTGGTLDLMGLLTMLLRAVDWPMLALGLVFALAVVTLASEFRRRWVLKG